VAAPVVDRIEKELADSAQVVRIDTQHVIGAGLADDYKIRAVPCILIFDGNGGVIYQNVGIPDPDHVRHLVRKIKTT
jgi:thioredoxin-related protein